MTYLTPAERRRVIEIRRRAAVRSSSPVRAAVRHEESPHGAWARTAKTGAFFALALAGALALMRIGPPTAGELASWIEWILPRVY